MPYCGQGLLNQVKAELGPDKAMTVDELAAICHRPRASIHVALHSLRTLGYVKRYAQIMTGKRGRPRMVYQVVS